MKQTVVACAILLVCSIVLTGCSRQSVTDFSPYPSQQSAMTIGFHPIPASFTQSDGVQVTFERVALGVTSIETSDSGATSRLALRAHTHDESETEPSSDSSSEAGDPNLVPSDDRPLTETALRIGSVVDLLLEQTLGVLHIRSGAETGWKVCLAPLESGSGSATVAISGKVRMGASESTLQVWITDPLELSFPAAKTGATAVELKLSPATWFEGIPLAQLAGSGPVVIREDTPEWHSSFISNFTGSVSSHDETH